MYFVYRFSLVFCHDERTPMNLVVKIQSSLWVLPPVVTQHTAPDENWCVNIDCGCICTEFGTDWLRGGYRSPQNFKIWSNCGLPTFGLQVYHHNDLEQNIKQVYSCLGPFIFSSFLLSSCLFLLPILSLLSCLFLSFLIFPLQSPPHLRFLSPSLKVVG